MYCFEGLVSIDTNVGKITDVLRGVDSFGERKTTRRCTACLQKLGRERKRKIEGRKRARAIFSRKDVDRFKRRRFLLREKLRPGL